GSRPGGPARPWRRSRGRTDLHGAHGSLPCAPVPDPPAGLPLARGLPRRVVATGARFFGHSVAIRARVDGAAVSWCARGAVVRASGGRRSCVAVLSGPPPGASVTRVR